MDVVRSRLAFQVADEQIYCGICHVIRQIITTEGGFAGLYRGYAATALSMIPAVGKSRWWSQKTSNQCVAPFLKYYYSQLTPVSDHPQGKY